jgi:hypothetical protein
MPSTRTNRTRPTTRLDHVLVVARRSHDDIPLRAFKTRGGARRFAATVTQVQIAEAADRVFDGDPLLIHNVALIEFRCGRPGHFEVVKDFQE